MSALREARQTRQPLNVRHPLLHQVRMHSANPDLAADFFLRIFHPVPTLRLDASSCFHHPYLASTVRDLTTPQQDAPRQLLTGVGAAHQDQSCLSFVPPISKTLQRRQQSSRCSSAAAAAAAGSQDEAASRDVGHLQPSTIATSMDPGHLQQPAIAAGDMQQLLQHEGVRQQLQQIMEEKEEEEEVLQQLQQEGESRSRNAAGCSTFRQRADAAGRHSGG